MASTKVSFAWDDPLQLDQQLTSDERAVRVVGIAVGDARGIWKVAVPAVQRLDPAVQVRWRE